MVGKAVVLFRVQHFQQCRSGIAAPVGADFVNFVQHNHGVAGAGIPQGTDYASGNGPNIGAAVAANFCFVPHAAEADAHHLAPDSAGHGGSD